MFQLLIRADQYRDDGDDHKVSRSQDRLEEVGDVSE